MENWIIAKCYTASGDSLTITKVGTKIICNWQNIKQKILNAVAEYKRREELMKYFKV